MNDISSLTEETKQALVELLDVAGLSSDDILVFGCSTSEINGKRIGSASNLEAAHAIIDAVLPLIAGKKLYLAIQCCEHLNRALVVEEECALKYGLEIVSVVPHEKAGGSLATVAMTSFRRPVVVETIAAHAGLDIGDTFIGMHLKRVAVPVRLAVKQIGKAHVTAARTRPKFIGGDRARYT